jgi:hypothetical protein
MIRIPEQSGIRMLDLRPVVEWFRFLMRFENWTNLSGFRMVRFSDNHFKNQIFFSGSAPNFFEPAQNFFGPAINFLLPLPVQSCSCFYQTNFKIDLK